MTERGATAVKICGIGSVADYDVCRSAGAAFVGMVFSAFPAPSRIRDSQRHRHPCRYRNGQHARTGQGSP